MLTQSQLGRLFTLSLVMWITATAYIHFLPGAVAGGLRGSIGFLTMLPVAWLSVRLIRSAGGLSARQLLPGVGVVGGVAMMLDAIAIRWFPAVYSTDPSTLRFGAAWLLWGYGVSLAVAVLMAAPARAENTRNE